MSAPEAEPVAIAEAERNRTPADLRDTRASGSREWLWSVLAISVGGFLGANARYLSGLWIAARWGETFPWGTLAVNLVGSFILGFYLTLVTERFTGRSTTRLFIATGFLGSLTTFSTFSHDAVALILADHIARAAAYTVANLALGLAAGIAGIVSARVL
jgi:CrcB protein